MILRVLLAQSGTEDSLFVRDVLTELDGARCWSDWVHLETYHALTWADTAAILATETVDIILLDPDLLDSRGIETFRRVQTAAPHVPVILLIDSAETSLAERMVRDGAQDFVLKSDLDCAPLARAIRNALERHRLLEAARATCMTDQLTGLLTPPAFLTLAKRDHLLAERLNLRMMILVAECVTPEAVDGVRANRAGDYSGQGRDLALVEAADDLRRLAGPAAVLGRLSHSQFGLSALDTVHEPVEEVRARIEAAEPAGKLACAAAVFDPRQPNPLDVLLELAANSLRSKSTSAMT